MAVGEAEKVGEIVKVLDGVKVRVIVGDGVQVLVMLGVGVGVRVAVEVRD